MKTKSARRTKPTKTNGSSSEPVKLTDESENKRHKSTDGKISGSTTQDSESETENGAISCTADDILAEFDKAPLQPYSERGTDASDKAVEQVDDSGSGSKDDSNKDLHDNCNALSDEKSVSDEKEGIDEDISKETDPLDVPVDLREVCDGASVQKIQEVAARFKDSKHTAEKADVLLLLACLTSQKRELNSSQVAQAEVLLSKEKAMEPLNMLTKFHAPRRSDNTMKVACHKCLRSLLDGKKMESINEAVCWNSKMGLGLCGVHKTTAKKKHHWRKPGGVVKHRCYVKE